jgi:acyl-CoA thioesterase
LINEKHAMHNPVAELHPFDAAIRLQTLGDGVSRGTTSADYWNLAGPFGGVTAAVLLQAILEHPRRQGEPVAITVNFCAALPKGSFEVAVRETRSGRSTQHWSAEMVDPDRRICATASVVCGVRREVWSHQSARAPAMPPAETIAPFPPVIPSAWLNRYQFRFAEGAPVIRERDSALSGPASRMWVNDWPRRPLDFVGLTALSDTFLIRILHVRGYMVPIGTITMSTYFFADSAQLAAQGDRPLIATADGGIFSGGFSDQTAALWSDQGQLLATSSQVVWYRE